MSWAKDVWPSERARLMSGHMMPTEREAVTVEIMQLEEWFDDDLACMGRDRAHGPEGCSGEVTHIANGCSIREVPVCASLVAHKSARIAAGAYCTACERFAGDCWDYRPI